MTLGRFEAVNKGRVRGPFHMRLQRSNVVVPRGAARPSREAFPHRVDAKYQSHKGGSNGDRHEQDQDPHAERIAPKHHQKLVQIPFLTPKSALMAAIIVPVASTIVTGHDCFASCLDHVRSS